MGFTIQEVENAVIRAKSAVTETSIDPEVINSVASVLATLELLGVDSQKGQADLILESMALPETFGEWAQHYHVETHFDRFLAATIYLREYEKVPAVNTEDMARMYRKAYWQKPKNMADVFAKGAERLFFTEAEEVGESGKDLKKWRVTNTGYERFHSLHEDVYNG